MQPNKLTPHSRPWVKRGTMLLARKNYAIAGAKLKFACSFV